MNPLDVEKSTFAPISEEEKKSLLFWHEEVIQMINIDIVYCVA